MPRRAANNPRQIRIKSCGCALCTAKFRPGQKATRKHCIGPWQARFRDPSGKQRGPTFRTEAEANAALDASRTRVREGNYLDPRRSRITVADWHAKWVAAQKGEPNTRKSRERMWRLHVEPKWGDWPLVEITHLDVQGWVAGELPRKLQPSSLRKPFGILTRMLAAAVRDRRLLYNPCDGVELPAKRRKHPKDRKPPTLEQVAAIRERLLPWHRPMVVVAEETGLRWGELAGLRACHVDLPGLRLHVEEVLEEIDGRVRRKEYPKTDAGLRTLPLTPRAVAALEQVLGERCPAPSRRKETRKPAATLSAVGSGLHAEELVFVTRRETPLTRIAFWRQWNAASARAGVQRKVIVQGRAECWPQVHKLRHLYASRLHDAGVPEAIVQEMLGHERAGAVTWLYTHAADDAAGQVLAAMRDAAEGRTLRAVA